MSTITISVAPRTQYYGTYVRTPRESLAPHADFLRFGKTWLLVVPACAKISGRARSIVAVTCAWWTARAAAFANGIDRFLEDAQICHVLHG